MCYIAVELTADGFWESPLLGNETLVLALPEGRILGEVLPWCWRAGIEIEPAFADEEARQLRFATNDPAARRHPRAQFRRRDLRRLRRGASGRRRQRRADGVRLSRDLCAARSRRRASAASSSRRPHEDARARRSAALEPCARRHQISRDHAAPFRRARRPGRMHQAQRAPWSWRRASASAGSIVDLVQTGATLQGERPRRDRAHRRHHLAPHRQPCRAEDPRPRR